jgi:hypothetical protein
VNSLNTERNGAHAALVLFSTADSFLHADPVEQGEAGKLLIDRSKHKKLSVENIINCPFKTKKAEM